MRAIKRRPIYDALSCFRQLLVPRQFSSRTSTHPNMDDNRKYDVTVSPGPYAIPIGHSRKLIDHTPDPGAPKSDIRSADASLDDDETEIIRPLPRSWAYGMNWPTRRTY